MLLFTVNDCIGRVVVFAERYCEDLMDIKKSIIIYFLFLFFKSMRQPKSLWFVPEHQLSLDAVAVMHL